MKHQISCLSYALRAAKWLEGTKSVQVLHRFPEALNLINERREVFSIVAPAVGNGPFSAVVDVGQLQGLFGGEEKIIVGEDRIMFGDTLISFDSVELWDPVPNWNKLASIRKTSLIAEIEKELQTAAGGLADVLYPASYGDEGSRYSDALKEGCSLLLEGLQIDHASRLRLGTAKLAGLGIGLTPSGDDFLMGVMYGLWATKPQQIANDIAGVIYAEAVGRTTTLSSAWLQAARDGEAGEKWHALIEAVCANQAGDVRRSIQKIIETGETSGGDALTGFVQVLKLELEL